MPAASQPGGPALEALPIWTKRAGPLGSRRAPAEAQGGRASALEIRMDCWGRHSRRNSLPPPAGRRSGGSGGSGERRHPWPQLARAPGFVTKQRTAPRTCWARWHDGRRPSRSGATWCGLCAAGAAALPAQARSALSHHAELPASRCAGRPPGQPAGRRAGARRRRHPGAFTELPCLLPACCLWPIAAVPSLLCVSSAAVSALTKRNARAAAAPLD